MIRTNDVLIAGLGLGISVFAIYLIRSAKKPTQQAEMSKENEKPLPQEKDTVSNKKTVQKASQTVSIPKQDAPFLSKGSKGKEVERLQIWLLRNHGWKGPVTGIYDEQTDRLVKKRFKTDGIDRATYEKYQMGIPIHELIKA